MRLSPLLLRWAKGKSAKDEAMEFLKDELANGEVGAGEIKRSATDAGIREKALRSACKALGIRPQKDGFKGGWIWELP